MIELTVFLSFIILLYLLSDSIKAEFIYVIIFSTFLLLILFTTTIILPQNFADDQVEYYSAISYSYDFSDYQYKNFVLQILFSPLVKFFNVSFNSLRMIIATIFISLLLLFSYKNKFEVLLPIIILFIPSVIIHSTLVLREIIVYSIIIIGFLFYANKKYKLFYITIFSLIFVRVDSFLLVSPFLFFPVKIINFRLKVFILLFLITLLWYLSIFFPQLNLFLSGYQSLFGITDQIGSFDAIYNGLKRFFGLGLNYGIPTFAILLESILLIMILKDREIRPYAIIAIIIGAMLIGQLSNNPGFILRLRSPVILTMLLLYLIKINERKNICAV
jgi:hypothetical protein